MSWTKTAWQGALVVLLILAMIGCSNDSILSPDSTDVSLMKGGTSNDRAALAEQVQIEGRVATTDVSLRTLTLVGQDYVITASADCEIVSISAGVETPLEFGDIEIDDSVRVCGILEDAQNILANRIRVFLPGDCPDYICIRDSIATIDYAATTFTVYNRTETIVIDENSVIWSVVGHSYRSLGDGEGPVAERFQNKFDRDTILAFTDLFVDAVVEVKATVLDPTTLYAVSIKLAGSNFKQCVTFEAFLASVDVDNRLVTFDDQAWAGSVCQGAKLLGLDGEPLTLADFAAGDFVAVKGFALSEDTLQVCLMEMKD